MISTQSLSAGCLAAQSVPCRRIRHTQLPARRVQPVLASAGQQAGGAGPTEPYRQKVAFLKAGSTLQVEDVTQDKLTRVLRGQGAVGFDAGGFISAALVDLPEGGRVQLMFMEDLFSLIREDEAKLRSLQQAGGYVAPSKVQVLGRLIQNRALAENRGALLTDLSQQLFKYPTGQEYLRMDAAFIAGETLHAGQYQRELNGDGVAGVQRMLEALRQREASPELAAALRGVKAVKLYLGFSAVQDRRTFEELADEAREEAIALVLLLDSDLD
ncbi:hypothetical protein ABPG77_009315 [Micractinium sp. CCAP 211/92]